MSEADDTDVLSTLSFTISLLKVSLSVGRVMPGGLPGCAWPLLKAMFSASAAGDASGFFCLTQEKDELTLMMDQRCRAAFDEAGSVATVEYAPSRWRAFELRLGSLGGEVPGLVCFLATLMAEGSISILNLSSHDRDFVLVQEGDVAAATRLICEGMQEDAVGLKEKISQRAMVRRSGCSSDSLWRGVRGASGDLAEELRALRQTALDGAFESMAGRGSTDADAPAAAFSSPALSRPASTLPPRVLLPAQGEQAGAEGGLAGRAAGSGELGCEQGCVEECVEECVEGCTEQGCEEGCAQRAAPDDAHGERCDEGRSRLRRLRITNDGGASADDDDDGADLYIRVLPTKLALVRLAPAMLQASTHTLVHRLLFGGSEGGSALWSYAHIDDDISLMVEEEALDDFPEGAIVGSCAQWRPLRLCGKAFGFDATGVVCAMYAPYEQGLPLLNISTYSTNISLIEEGDLDRAIASFDLPVLRPSEDEDDAGSGLSDGGEA